MTNVLFRCLRSRVVMGMVLLAAPTAAFAQTDEIQVYDAEIADQGVFNVMNHLNYTPIGRKTGDFPGSIVPNHSVNGALEWHYGVYRPGSNRGCICRCTALTRKGVAGRSTASKIRELFVRPHAKDHTFFYGLNS